MIETESYIGAFSLYFTKTRLLKLPASKMKLYHISFFTYLHCNVKMGFIAESLFISA